MAVLPVLPSFHRQILNSILCVVTFFFIFRYFRRFVTFAPITFESIWQISLAEINRRKNVERVKQLEQKLSLQDAEKGVQTKDDVAARCIASVVGYREEANLWRRCLQSYHNSPGLDIMLIGIDGDHDGDMEMVSVAQQVCIPYPNPQNCSAVVYKHKETNNYSSEGISRSSKNSH